MSANGSAPAESDFDCEFNAPQFFDFNALHEDGGERGAGGAINDQQFAQTIDDDAEKYFEVDHENERKIKMEDDKDDQRNGKAGDKQKDEERAKEDEEHAKRPSGEDEMANSPSLRDLLRQKGETPTRKRLREQVAKTVEAVANSPKLEVPKPQIRRSVNPLGLTPGGGVSKAASASPAIQRWKGIVRTMTPEVIKRAMAMRKNAAAPAPSREAELGNKNVKKNFKAQMANANRLASQTTSASRARAVLPAVAPAANPKVGGAGGITKLAPFSFATDSRIGTGGHHGPMKASAVDFSKMLRNFKATDGGTDSGSHQQTTIPKPFNLSSQNRRRRSRSCDPSPSRRHVNRSSPYKNEQQQRLRNRSPNKTDRSRRGPSPTPSLASSTGSASSSRAPTEPQPFSFVNRDLAKNREKAEIAAKQAAEERVDFYKNLRSYSGQESAAEPERTVLQPFSFDSRPRRSRSVEPEPRVEPEVPRIIKAKPAPHFGVPVHLPNMSQRPINTVAEPFSFHSRDQHMFSKKAQLIEKVLEDEKKAREFRANPLPDISKVVGLPSREVQMATEAKPFNLEIEKRVEARVNKWQEDVEEELRRQRDATHFKANPATVLEREAFVPKPSDKPLSEVGNFELHSDRRAIEREGFERQKKMREAELESMKRQLEDRRHAEDDDAVRRQRAEAVHRAQPVKHYRPIEVLPSDKPVTAPISPKFSVLNATRKHQEKKE